MGAETDRIEKERERDWGALLVKALKAGLPMLIVGGMGGGVAAGGIAAVTPSIPVPNGVAKEVALQEVKAEMATIKDHQAAQSKDIAELQRGQAVQTAELRAIVESVGHMRSDFKDLARELREREKTK